jgi:hypothetical protein
MTGQQISRRIRAILFAVVLGALLFPLLPLSAQTAQTAPDNPPQQADSQKVTEANNPLSGSRYLMF